ncbi:22.7 kDa class IV heat shock protein-like [Benincasa hispida]|uniref:22.7 kDa class IV heat shock protein-like n=1 Tax=Benincasa hispida TaxID=102211 RepID=UPI0018FF7A15|nr:22.7 kDa class IV heat shock protein-like [Benincasa hispida]
MSNPIPLLLCLLTAAFTAVREAESFVPYTGAPWGTVVPSDDPFRILEQMTLTIPRGMETVALAQVDWKETSFEHKILIDIPGMKKEDVKVEVEENRVLRISGERRAAAAVEEGERWHRAERVNGKFWRQFRMPGNANLDGIKANLEDGVLKIRVPKLVEEKRRQPKIISVLGERPSDGETDLKVSKDEM